MKATAVKTAPIPVPAQPKTSKEPGEQMEEQISRRAHELYEQRGKQDGYDLQDWLQAESELTEVTGLKRKAVAV